MSDKLEKLKKDLEKVKAEKEILEQKILELSVQDILDKFKPGKYYNVQYDACRSFYYKCTKTPKIRQDKNIILHDIIEVLMTRMFYDVTLQNVAMFALPVIMNFDIKEISEKEYLEEISELEEKLNKLKP